MVSSIIKENCVLVGCHNVLYVYIACIASSGYLSSIVIYLFDDDDMFRPCLAPSGHKLFTINNSEEKTYT